MFNIDFKLIKIKFIIIIFSIIFYININAQTCEVPLNRLIYVLGPDNIPALTNPAVIAADWATNPSISEFDEIGFNDNDLIIGVYIDGEARAYPHRIFWWHEIINDVLGGKEIAVSYCPLTGTGITFERIFAEKIRTLGVSGKLYNNNLVMYDRDSETLFPQMCPKGITGPLAGTNLNYFPSVETTWGMWKKMYPSTSIVGFNTGYSRDYRNYPYSDYITNHNYMLFGIQPDDTRLLKKDMVSGITIGNEAKVYPFKYMGENSVINDEIGSGKVLILYHNESNMAVAYSRIVDSQIHNFQISNIPGNNGMPFEFVDNETGTVWNIKGEAVSGPLQGVKLQQIETGYTGFFAHHVCGSIRIKRIN